MVRYDMTADFILRQLEQTTPSSDLVLTLDTDRAQAIGLAWVMNRGVFGRSAYLRLLGVHPDHAGTGFGSTLLHAAEAHSHAADRDLLLLVSDFNTAAQRFYQRHGYTQIGTLPGYVLPDVAELIFWKRPPGR